MRISLTLAVAAVIAIVAACFLGSTPLPAERLFAALLGDGWWDVLSWVGLGLPAWYGFRGFFRSP